MATYEAICKICNATEIVNIGSVQAKRSERVIGKSQWSFVNDEFGSHCFCCPQHEELYVDAAERRLIDKRLFAADFR